MLNYRSGYKSFIIAVILISQAVEGFSQNSMSDIIELRRDSYREKIFIGTDRDVYFTGETIWMNIILLDANSGKPEKMSRVVYFDLLDRENNPAIQVKQSAGTFSSSACLIIPDSLGSGIYTLRGYTSWMLDFNEDDIFQKTVTVINPLKKIYTKVIPAASLLSLPAQEKKCEVRITNDKAEYGKRQRIVTGINITDDSGKPFPAEISVSVARSSLVVSEKKDIREHLLNDESQGSDENYIFRMPEPEGLIVRGTMLENATAQPFINEDVSLSIVGKSARCIFGKTNERGEFAFLLKDLNGIGEIVIQPVSADHGDIYVELEQPFFEKYGLIDQEVLIPDTAGLKGINEASIASQVSRIYREENLYRQKSDSSRAWNDFYGEPSRRVMLGDYIELTDLREVVRELLPEVMVTRKDGKLQLKVTSKNPYETFNEQALVLIDGVPIQDMEKLLSLSSKEIERIDIVKKKYYRHDLIFDGIVSFVTRKGDLSVFEADNTVFRQVFEGIQLQRHFYDPGYEADSLRNSRVPDTRNTLFWKTGLKPDAEGNVSFDFFSSDESGEFTIIVEGITEGGEHFTGRQKLLLNGK